MTQHDLAVLTLWLAREVARIHAVNASLLAVVEELRIFEPRLDKIDAHQIQKDSWQVFFAKLEDLNPEIAAMIDNRPDGAI